MIVERIVVGSMEVNCYLIAADKQGPAVIIDPGDDPARIRRGLDKLGMVPACVINTHGHFDHIGCDDAFGVPVYAHSQEVALLRDSRKNYSSFLATPIKVTSEIRTLADRQILAVAGMNLEVLHVPGHSPGGICLSVQEPSFRAVFTGDSLFRESIGRTDLGGNEFQLLEAIRSKLLVLPEETIVYPGHGPASTIGHERSHNPFLV